MIDVSGVNIRELFIHKVGNLLRNEGTVIAKTPQKLTNETFGPVTQFLFAHADRLNSFEFSHSVDTELNALSAIASALKKSPLQSLEGASQKIAAHLYSVSNHPRVKAGNLFVGVFEGIVWQKKSRTALGIFKSDATSPFIKVDAAKGSTSLNVDQGAPITSLDKIALIFLPEKDGTLPVLAACARGEDAVFWNDRFLQITPTGSSKTKTKAYLDTCRAFAVDDAAQLSATDRVVFLNRSLEFFEGAKRFNEEAFSAVFANEDQKTVFNRLLEQRTEDLTGTSTSFSIEKTVVKKQRAKFERNMKLDSHIEIRLRFSDRSEMEKRVEHGFDTAKRLPYYKLYYTKD